MTVLEKNNLLTVGLTSFNFKGSVPSDISVHNQYIPPENLKSNQYIQDIQKWTSERKMKLNEKKTKIMIFNFTKNHKFTTRLKLRDENIEIVNSAKLLGTIVTDSLTWDENTNYLVQKAHNRMQLLRKVASFTSSKEEKKIIYISYIRYKKHY